MRCQRGSAGRHDCTFFSSYYSSQLMQYPDICFLRTCLACRVDINYRATQTTTHGYVALEACCELAPKPLQYCIRFASYAPVSWALHVCVICQPVSHTCRPVTGLYDVANTMPYRYPFPHFTNRHRVVG